MSTIRIHRRHELSPSAVRHKAESVARRIEQRHDVRWRWEGDSLELSAPTGLASGTHGRVTIGQRDVAIELHLSLALRPVRRLVERELAAKLEEFLGAA